MASSESGAQMQPCPGCGQSVETSDLEPFARVDCPGCGFQLRVERAFENYVVVEPLGTGGMGSVYKARDTRLNRFVALKLLRKEFAGDVTFTARLQEEARLTGSIKHPHVVEVFAVGEDHGQCYVVMELVDGGSLDDRLEDEKCLSELQTLELGVEVAKGLQAALAAGLIHRDIKPGNILFANDQTAKIVDFGLALLAAQHAETEGEIWGTPYYVAPERLIGAQEDFRSDLYSLGATLFHAASGRPTFENETQSAAELKRLKSDPVGLKSVAPEISDATAGVIDRMLRPEPADRHGSYQELIAELQAAHAGVVVREEELRARGSWPQRILVSLGALLLLGAMVFGSRLALQHLPRKEPIEMQSGPASMADAKTRAAQLAMARRELEVGHYATAEPLFRELAAAQPEVWPAAELCAALQLWERGQFSQAASGLQRLGDDKPGVAWFSRYRTLAQDRLSDYRLLNEWERARSATQEPQVALTTLREIEKKLKTRGALSFQLTDEERKLSAEVAQLSEKGTAGEKAVEAREAPRWQTVLVRARQADVAYQFQDAVEMIAAVKLKSTSLQEEREKELQRTRWLADWQAKLIHDLNHTSYNGVVTDLHGMRYDGPVRRASPEKLELKTRYGSVMTSWLNLSPPMLLQMSTAFIRPGARDQAERQWLCAIFAAQTGQAAAASDLAAKAAAAKSKFRRLRPRFFSGAKK